MPTIYKLQSYAVFPSPIHWVNIKKIRVKDSFTRIWWMSKNQKTKANNRRILVPYSDAMRKLLNTQSYNSGKRPSQYTIGEKSFRKDNGGAIPPNIFNGSQKFNNFLTVKPTFHNIYNEVCRLAIKIKVHPARMSPVIPEFFIKFLTNEKDIVFARSVCWFKYNWQCCRNFKNKMVICRKRRNIRLIVNRKI